MSVEIREVEQREDTIEVTALREKQRVAKDLGLTGQVGLIQAQIDHLTLGSRPLAQWEMNIWQWWLPTRYSDGHYGFSNYTYDEMPLEVMEHLPEWRKRFANLIIATPERIAPSFDPALFGQRSGLTFLLARWGESDASLLSFKEIARRVRGRFRRRIFLFSAPIVLLLVIVGAVVVRMHDPFYFFPAAFSIFPLAGVVDALFVLRRLRA